MQCPFLDKKQGNIERYYASAMQMYIMACTTIDLYSFDLVLLDAGYNERLVDKVEAVVEEGECLFLALSYGHSWEEKLQLSEGGEERGEGIKPKQAVRICRKLGVEAGGVLFCHSESFLTLCCALRAATRIQSLGHCACFLGDNPCTMRVYEGKVGKHSRKVVKLSYDTESG